jgi:inhibitor of cysteine peptidase
MLSNVLTILFMVCSTTINAANISATATKKNVYTENQQAISVTANEPVFILKLKSNPTTGYTWILRNYDARLLTLVTHHYQAGKPRLIGSGGFEWWTFRANPALFAEQKPATIHIIYARAWEKNNGVKTADFIVTPH